ncbi:MAG: hypothetical protein ABEH64_06130 [Salinirussus sp.]
MGSSHSPLLIVAVALVLFAAATGSAIGVVAIPDPTPAALGTGDVTLSVVSEPDGAQLRADRYTDVYQLHVPPVILDVEALSGAPTVTASLDLDRLGYTRSSVFTLRSTGRKEIQVQPTTLDADRIRNDSYSGRLRLVLRSDAGDQLLVNRSIRIEVVE